MRFFLACVFFLSTFAADAATTKKIYINRGVFTAVDSTTFPYIAYNSKVVFKQNNLAIKVEVDDTLFLLIINTDTVSHGFKIDAPLRQHVIFPQDTIWDTLVFTQRAIIPFYDHTLFPESKNAGLCGMICVLEDLNDNWYSWNLKDHQSSVQPQITSGGTNDWQTYLPDYFTINEMSFADIQSDSLSAINNSVGDTIYIYVLNAGQSMHSLHFHGFHTEAVYTDCRKIQTGWIKDTWGMFSMDAMVLKLIPDKPGQYSVHDHNLVALTAGGTHPNGMFTIMTINP
jgi:hypothetical protein